MNFAGIDTAIVDCFSDFLFEIGDLSEDMSSLLVLGTDSNRVIIFSRSLSHFVVLELPQKLFVASLSVLFAIV